MLPFLPLSQGWIFCRCCVNTAQHCSVRSVWLPYLHVHDVLHPVLPFVCSARHFTLPWLSRTAHVLIASTVCSENKPLLPFGSWPSDCGIKLVSNTSTCYAQCQLGINDPANPPRAMCVRNATTNTWAWQLQGTCLPPSRLLALFVMLADSVQLVTCVCICVLIA